MILFAAIPIPAPIAKDIDRMQRGVAGARWRSEDQLHLTLAYFGEVDDRRAEVLDDSLASFDLPSFDLTLSGGGRFGGSTPHAIWAGVQPSEDLTRLNKTCKKAAREARIDMEARKYMPHVTLAYMRPQMFIETDERPASPLDRIIAFEQRMAAFRAGPFLVDHYALYSSHSKKKGPNLYRVEATYPLLGRS